MRLINLFVLLLIISSCSGKKDNYVLSGKIIEVQFSKGILQDDWFKLDDLVFNHVHSDTSMVDEERNLSEFGYFDNNSKEFADKGILPISQLHFHHEDIRGIEKVTPGRMAGLFVQRLFHKQADLQENDLIYQVGKAEYPMLEGKVYIKRSDDRPIEITSNAKGRIYFKELSDKDEVYQKLFQ